MPTLARIYRPDKHGTCWLAKSFTNAAGMPIEPGSAKTIILPYSMGKPGLGPGREVIVEDLRPLPPPLGAPSGYCVYRAENYRPVIPPEQRPPMTEAPRPGIDIEPEKIAAMKMQVHKAVEKISQGKSAFIFYGAGHRGETCLFVAARSKERIREVLNLVKPVTEPVLGPFLEINGAEGRQAFITCPVTDFEALESNASWADAAFVRVRGLIYTTENLLQASIMRMCLEESLPRLQQR